MNTNENQNLNPVVPPTTTPGGTPVPPTNPGFAMPTPPPPMNTPQQPQTQAVPPVEATPSPTVTPTSPVMNLQPEGTVTPQASPPPIAEPLMGTTLTDQTVLNPTGTPPTGANQMQAPGIVQPIGEIPPMGTMPDNMGMMGGIPAPPSMTPEPGKGKKKMNPLIIVLVVVLIFAVGFGVYYFLNTSKKPSGPSISIRPTLTNIELGHEILPTQVALFAIVSGYDITSCTVNTDLDFKRVGSYQYTVTCGSVTSESQIVTVTDTVAPEVEVQDLIVLPNTPVSPADFILKIKDYSDYTMKFEKEVDTSEEGEQEVIISVEDDFQNKTQVPAKLTISEDAPDYYLNCSQRGKATNITQDVVVQNFYRYGISALGEFYNARKSVIYTFQTEEDFMDVINELEDTDSFDGLTGRVIVDNDNLTITVISDVTIDDLSKEYNVDEFPTLDIDIEDFYDTNEGACNVE